MGTSSKIISLWLLMAVLSACSHQSPGPAAAEEEPPAEEPEAPEELETTDNFIYDVMTTNGIKIELNEHVLVPPLADIDTWYMETQACIGFGTVEQPHIVIVDDTREICGDGARAVVCTSYEPDLIAVQTDWSAFEYIWKHEFIHFILNLNGFDPVANLNHEPESLWNCQFQ